MKHLLLAMSMLLFGGAAYSETTTLNINPTTGAITTPDAVITDLAAANVQAMFYGNSNEVIMLSTSTRTWLSISNQWYVKNKDAFTLVFDDDGNPGIPTGFELSSTNPYLAEPILIYEEINSNDAFGSCNQYIKWQGKWRKVSKKICPPACIGNTQLHECFINKFGQPRWPRSGPNAGQYICDQGMECR